MKGEAPQRENGIPTVTAKVQKVRDLSIPAEPIFFVPLNQ